MIAQLTALGLAVSLLANTAGYASSTAITAAQAARLATTESRFAEIRQVIDFQPKEKIVYDDTPQWVDEPEPDFVSPEVPVSENELVYLGVFRLSAYCSCITCCGSWSADHPSRIGTDYTQTTASGTTPTAYRTIAVDTGVIPLGSRVSINGAEYIAEDVGGGVSGNHIDIYFDSHEAALAFGVQEADVYIIN